MYRFVARLLSLGVLDADLRVVRLDAGRLTQIRRSGCLMRHRDP